MKQHEVVFSRANNENADTAPDPLCLLGSRSLDMTSQTTCCINWDNNGLVSVPTYEVHEVTLPDFLSVEDWISHSIAWKFAWAMGVDPQWPEAWQKSLLDLDHEMQLICSQLLKTKTFRSSFRKSCRDQLVSWLDSNNRRYDSSFSDRQFEALANTHTKHEADSRSSSAYRKNRYAPDIGCTYLAEHRSMTCSV